MVAYFFLKCSACAKSHLLCLREGDEVLPAFPFGKYRFTCPETGNEVIEKGIQLNDGYLEDIECPDDSILVDRVA